MATTKLPNPTITAIPDTEPDAVPALWNVRYEEQDENNAALLAGLNAVESELKTARGEDADLDTRLDDMDAAIAALDPSRNTGDITLYNRGVVTGCAVSKSTDATRNLNVEEGLIFAHGRQYAVSELLNTAAVPTNSGDSAATCYAYLYEADDGTIKCDCTELGEDVPDNGIAIALLTVPAANTEDSDAYLEEVTLTDIRRLEPNWPLAAGSPEPVDVVLETALDTTDYHVSLQVLDCEGGRTQIGEVYVADQLTNGFKVYATGGADAIEVRYFVNANTGASE